MLPSLIIQKQTGLPLTNMLKINLKDAAELIMSTMRKFTSDTPFRKLLKNTYLPAEYPKLIMPFQQKLLVSSVIEITSDNRTQLIQEYQS